MLPSDKPADKDAERGDPAAAVDINLSRVRVTPAAEWRQMFEEAGRVMRDNLWVADMAGNDWAALLARYRPLVARIATRDDLSDLLWEAQGELGTSHAFEIPPERPAPEERQLGHLGADFEQDEDGLWRITRVPQVKAPREPAALRCAHRGLPCNPVRRWSQLTAGLLTR